MLPTDLFVNGFNNCRKPEETPTPIDVQTLADIRKFIAAHFVKAKAINLKRGSYGLKHVVERGLGRYIANGDLIAAMILEGYTYKQSDANAHFNITQGSINKANELASRYAEKVDE